MSRPHAPTHVSVADAAARVGCCQKTIRRYIALGELPAYRVGRRTIRLKIEDVDALFRPIPTIRQGA